MIECDETRGHMYARVSNVKLAEFNCSSNSIADEFDNLTDEKDPSGQEMFIYFFKVMQRRIFYTESRKQHLKLYDMDNKQTICTADFNIWPQLIALSPCANYVAVLEDKKIMLGNIIVDPTNEGKAKIEVIRQKDQINEEFPVHVRFARFGNKGLRIITTSPDMCCAISDIDLEHKEYFHPQKGNKLHEHWVTITEWHEPLGMLVTYGQDQTFSMVLWD